MSRSIALLRIAAWAARGLRVIAFLYLAGWMGVALLMLGWLRMT